MNLNGNVTTNKMDWGNPISRLSKWSEEALRTYLHSTRRGERLVSFVILVRLLLLYDVVVQFGIYRADLARLGLLNLARTAVWLVFLYILSLGYLRLNHPQIFFSSRSKYLQVVLDTLLFSVLYLFSQRAESDLFVLYLVPLLIASDYLEFTSNILVFGVVSLAFTGTAYAITLVFASHPAHMFLQVIAPRLAFFGMFESGLWVLRRLSPALSLDQDRSRLSRAMSELCVEPYVVGTDYRLQWVSPRLQSRHGQDLAGRVCFAYFAGRSAPCSGCPLDSGRVATLSHKGRVEVTARDVFGVEYQAEINVTPVSDMDGVWAAAVLKDVTVWNQCDRELEAYANRVDELADAQVRGLAEQTRQISDRLTSFFEATMLSTVGDRQEEETLEAILSQFARQMRSNVACLRTLGQNEAGEHGLVLRAEYGVPDERKTEVMILPLVSESLAVKAFESCMPRTCLDLQDRSQPSIHFVDLAQQDGLHSVASFPLIVHGKAIGTCTFYRDKVLPFTSDEMALGQAMGNLLAIALDNLQLYSEQEQRIRERQNWLDILHESSTFLAGNEPLDSIMHRALELAQQRLQAETGAIFLWENGRLRRKAIVGVPGDWFSAESYDLGEGLTGKVICPPPSQRYGQPVLCNNVDQEPNVVWSQIQRYREVLSSHEVKHLIAVPLNNRERSFGVLRVVNRLEGEKLNPNGFIWSDVDLLEIMATSVAMAVDNRRLFEAEKGRRELTERLVAASTAVTSSLDLNLVFEQILDQLRAVASYDSASIQILRPDGFHIVACRGFDAPDKVKGLVFPLQPRFPNTRVFQRKEAYIVNHVQAEYYHFIDPAWQGTHIQSWLGVPMCYHGEIVGMIALDSKTPGFYSAEHADVAIGFATQAAIVLTNATLYEETSRQARQSNQIVEVARQLISLNDAQLLASHVVDSAMFIIENAEGAVFHHLDAPTGRLLSLAARPSGRSVAGEAPMTLGHGVAGVALQTRKTINVPDVTLDARFVGPHEDRLRSLLVAPLYVGDRKLIGTVSVYSSQEQAFDKTDANLLTMLASLSGVVWANIETWQAREERRRQVERLLETVREFEIDIGLRALCRIIAQSACDILGWKASAIKILDERRENFEVYAVVPDTGSEAFAVQDTAYPATAIRTMTQGAIPLGHCLWVPGAYDRMRHRVAGEQSPLLNQQVSLLEWEAGDALLVPLQTWALDRIGYLMLADPQRTARPSTDEVQLIEFFGSHAAAAIARVSLYQETVAQRDRLQVERKRLENELHEAMNVLATGVKWEVDTTRQAFLDEREADVEYGLNRINASAKRAYEDLKYCSLAKNG
jgi:GAF domain-containing protein